MHVTDSIYELGGIKFSYDKVTEETNASCSLELTGQMRSVVGSDTATKTSKSFNIDGAELGRSDGTVDGIKLGTTDGVLDGSRLGTMLILGSRLGRLLRLG